MQQLLFHPAPDKQAGAAPGGGDTAHAPPPRTSVVQELFSFSRVTSAPLASAREYHTPVLYALKEVMTAPKPVASRLRRDECRQKGQEEDDKGEVRIYVSTNGRKS